jgi:aarF domain-containing kinase
MDNAVDSTCSIGDPHPGNVLVRMNPHKKNQVQVVLIDHGLYIQESEK